MILLVVILAIWIYFIISNTYWYSKCRSLYKRFSSDKEMTSRIPDVDELFKKAGTSYKTTYTEFKGNYQECSLKDVSYLSDKNRYYKEVNKVFLVTLGTFRKRLKQSIFPIHIVFLPSYLFNAKEKRVPSLIKFVLTIIYWIVGSLAAYHFDALLDFLYLEYLQSVLERILQGNFLWNLFLSG